jgi:hypothetical protein
MAVKSMAYDHPAYLVPQSVGGNIIAGVATQFKFACWTTMILKSVQVTSNGAGKGAAADVVLVHKISNQGTTTTSLANVGTWTAAQLLSKQALGTFTFVAGDQVAITKGTDATVTYACGLELYVSPGADVTG